MSAKNKRSSAPAIRQPVEMEIDLPPFEKHVLSNGVEVIALNSGNEDTLMINWVFRAGNWYEEKKLQSVAVNSLLKNGTSRHSAFEVNEHFDYYGSWLSRACYSETAEFTLHCLNKHLPELLPMVAEVLMESVFPEEEIGIYIQNARQRLKVGLQKSDFVAGRLIDAYLFGEKHPYGSYSNLDDYSAIHREDLLPFYEKYYKQGRCLIFTAGKLPADLMAQLEKNFGDLPLRAWESADAEPVHLIEPSLQKKYMLVNDPNGVQASIRIGRSFHNRHHPDFQKTIVLNNLFGGYFGSRLMATIREEKGYTYGIYSYVANQLQECSWIISTEAGRDVMAATMEEIYNEMKLLREKPVEEEELQLTRNFMMGSILGDLDGPFQVITRWKTLMLNGLDKEYFYRGLHTIRNVTPAELQELANRYLHPDQFYELVVV